MLGERSLVSLQEQESYMEEDFQSTTANEGIIIQTTWYRWLVLAFLCLNITVNSVISIGISPVAPVIQQAYNLETTFIPNLCYLSFPLFSLLFTPVAIYLFQDRSVSNLLRAATVI